MLQMFFKKRMHGFGHQSFVDRYNLDVGILSLICLLFALGFVVIFSSQGSFSLVHKQVLRVSLAFMCMFVMAQVSPRMLSSWTPWLFGVGVFLLVVVLLLGHISKGAQRWLDLGFIKFQPAELIKIALPLMLARYFEAKILPPRLTQLIIPVFLIMVPAVLIGLQPDLGTALLVTASGLSVIFLAGMRWKHIFTCCGVGAFLSPVFWFILKDYQKARIMTLFFPDRDPLKSGYHIIQSKIAIGSGGLYGKGWLQGSQTKLEFLPERSTDFIFAVYGEEFGLIGCILLLSLYLVLILRGFYISTQAQDTFSRLVAGSLTLTFFVYVFVNIGMVCGILPVVGIPLPLISYGGSSLVTIMLGFGILMSIKSNQSLVRK